MTSPSTARTPPASTCMASVSSAARGGLGRSVLPAYGYTRPDRVGSAPPTSRRLPCSVPAASTVPSATTRVPMVYAGPSSASAPAVVNSLAFEAGSKSSLSLRAYSTAPVAASTTETPQCVRSSAGVVSSASAAAAMVMRLAGCVCARPMPPCSKKSRAKIKDRAGKRMCIVPRSCSTGLSFICPFVSS